MPLIDIFDLKTVAAAVGGAGLTLLTQWISKRFMDPKPKLWYQVEEMEAPLGTKNIRVHFGNDGSIEARDVEVLIELPMAKLGMRGGKDPIWKHGKVREGREDAWEMNFPYLNPGERHDVTLGFTQGALDISLNVYMKCPGSNAVERNPKRSGPLVWK